MKEYEKTILPHIEAIYESFTSLEKNIADFFLHNKEKTDLSSKSVAQRLYVSEATLSRFAKKCGYKGYREFIFYYEQGGSASPQSTSSEFLKSVLNNYQELLTKSYSLIDEGQLERVAQCLTGCKRIYIYGKGSSGLAAMEMKLRFMRIGLNIEAITDGQLMRMNSVILDEHCAVIGISVSGKTAVVLEALEMAKQRNAATVLLTARMEKRFCDFCDEVLLIAVKESLEQGKLISPQFPVLVMVDALYAMMMRLDEARREALHHFTMEALEDKKPHT